MFRKDEDKGCVKVQELVAEYIYEQTSEDVDEEAEAGGDCKGKKVKPLDYWFITLNFLRIWTEPNKALVKQIKFSKKSAGRNPMISGMVVKAPLNNYIKIDFFVAVFSN